MSRGEKRAESALKVRESPDEHQRIAFVRQAAIAIAAATYADLSITAARCVSEAGELWAELRKAGA